METVVLPAQDHLAQERYRHQSRVMSGMIYPPVGGLPPTRRKVKSSQQAFPLPAFQSEIAKVSSEKNFVHVADSMRSGFVSRMEMSIGALRSGPTSHSTSSRPPSSVLKAPQYRLNSSSPSVSTSSEYSSQSRLQQDIATSLAAAASVSNGVPNGISHDSRLVLLRRSDGDSLPQGLRKGFEGENLSSDKRESHEKGTEGSKGSQDRKAVEKDLEKYAEKSSDRRKGVERRTMEKRVAGGPSGIIAPKNGKVQKKAGVITILQRPQTKEAAAENIALFTGRSIEVVTNQVLKSTQEELQVCAKNSQVDAAAPEAVKDGGASSKEEMENVGSRKASKDISPKRILRKKPPRDNAGKPSARTIDVLAPEPRRIEDGEFHGESRRQKSGSPPADATPVEEHKSDSEFRVQSRKLTAEKYASFTTEKVVLKSDSVDKYVSFDPHGTVLGEDSASPDPDLVAELVRLRGTLRRGSSDSLGDVKVLYAPKYCHVISRTGSLNGLEMSERWAGPAYTKSPPPSTLPVPKFVTTAEVAMQGSQDTNSETSSSSPPSPSYLTTNMFLSAAMQQSPSMDPSSATKDLRRILNLDVEWEGGVEVATQSLKRILQLG